MWSQDAQKTLLDSLEVFLKNPQKIFHFLLFFSKSKGILNNVLAAKNGLLARLKTPKIAPESKNAIFLKVCDIDTTIQPGKKEGQTDVSSALKRF